MESKKPKFAVGKVVSLKSSDVVMSVSGVHADGTYTCVWIDSDRRPQTQVFHESLLRHDKVHPKKSAKP